MRREGTHVGMQCLSQHIGGILVQENASLAVSVLCHAHAAECILLGSQVRAQGSDELILGAAAVLRPAHQVTLSVLATSIKCFALHLKLSLVARFKIVFATQNVHACKGKLMGEVSCKGLTALNEA